MNIRVKITRDGSNIIKTMDLEEYLRCVVPSEMPASWPDEALKAQAVAARTYAMRRILTQKTKEYDVDDTVASQAYRIGNEHAPTDKAIKDTINQHLTYGGKVIDCVYSSSNGGRTRSAEERWGNAIAYLPAQDDPYNPEARNGHSVGMSQYGAKHRAEAGHTYKDILAFYYPGAVLIGEIKEEPMKMDVQAYFDGWVRPIKDYAPYRDNFNEKRGTNSFHNGIDIKAPADTEIYSVRDGVVESIGYTASAGNYVRIQHDGFMTSNCHMIRKTTFLKVGDEVKAGQLIGHVGSTGSSDCNHLHIGKKIGNVWDNPYGWLMAAYERYPETFYKAAPYYRKGEHIRLMQERLTLHGFACTADGVFGPKTLDALKKFQKAKGLKVDGNCGSLTWSALEVEPGSTPPPSGWILKRILKQGMRGDDVKDVQTALITIGYSCGKAGADGIFGKDTLAAVKAFQKSRNLKVDGKVGKDTCTALGGTWKG